jgi:hypothetical protein
MIIIGVDFHPEFQQIASVDSESGEFQEKRRYSGFIRLRAPRWPFLVRGS